MPTPQRPDYRKRVRFYLDFCDKHGHPERSPTSLGPFLSKLAAKNQSAQQRHQAADAIGLLLGGPVEPRASLPAQTAKGPASSAPTASGRSQAVVPRPVTPQVQPTAKAQGRFPAERRRSGQLDKCG
jgi:hypothetical protein